MTTPRRCNIRDDADDDDDADAVAVAVAFDTASASEALADDADADGEESEDDETEDADADEASDQCVDAAMGTLQPPSSERSNARSAAQHRCVPRWSWASERASE